MKTRDWKSKDESKALIIGHDPRLQKSDTIADYALFADYYFRPEPKNKLEKRKYGLAKSTFRHILYLTNSNIKPEEIYLTNLCNEALPHAPKGKTVYINKIKALEGIKNIRRILHENPTIEYIFPMSLQVNYWLQKLNFYSSTSDFVANSEPRVNGIHNIEPYFEPKKVKTFLSICGNRYKATIEKQIVIPILHSKNFPLKNRFIAYDDCYEKIKKYFK